MTAAQHITIIAEAAEAIRQSVTVGEERAAIDAFEEAIFAADDDGFIIDVDHETGEAFEV